MMTQVYKRATKVDTIYTSVIVFFNILASDKVKNERNNEMTRNVYTDSIVTPHAQSERGKVIDRGVHIYIYICLGRKKYLNRTLEIDSPFQMLTVGLLVEFID